MRARHLLLRRFVRLRCWGGRRLVLVVVVVVPLLLRLRDLPPHGFGGLVVIHLQVLQERLQKDNQRLEDLGVDGGQVLLRVLADKLEAGG